MYMGLKTKILSNIHTYWHQNMWSPHHRLPKLVSRKDHVDHHYYVLVQVLSNTISKLHPKDSRAKTGWWYCVLGHDWWINQAPCPYLLLFHILEPTLQEDGSNLTLKYDWRQARMGSHSCQCTIHTSVIFLISHISMSFARYVL